MSDLWHEFGGDLALSPSGDLLTVSGTEQGQQRVLRRLLTNPGGYIWQLGYGAGLAAFVGQVNPGRRMQAVARQQMRREAAVAASPPPTVTTYVTPAGQVTLSVSYTDAVTGGNVTLSAPVG